MNTRLSLRILTSLLFFLFLTLLPVAASASGTDSMPWDTGLQTIENALTGTTIRVIGVIITVGVGIAIAFTEGQAIRKFLWVIVGLGIGFNAFTFMNTLFPNAGGVELRVLSQASRDIILSLL
jgi:type IV secretion system protein VirB2